MFVRRRPLMRAAMVGGGAYMVGKNAQRRGDQNADQTEKRDVQGDRPQRELEDNQINWQRSERRSHPRRQELLDGTRREKAPRDLRHDAAHDEPDREDHTVKHRAVLR